MAASLLDLLNREKELVDHINEIDDLLKEVDKRRLELIAERQSTDMKLKSARSVLAGYVEKNLIKLPNHDPYKHPEVQK